MLILQLAIKASAYSNRFCILVNWRWIGLDTHFHGHEDFWLILEVL